MIIQHWFSLILNPDNYLEMDINAAENRNFNQGQFILYYQSPFINSWLLLVVEKKQIKQ